MKIVAETLVSQDLDHQLEKEEGLNNRGAGSRKNSFRRMTSTGEIDRYAKLTASLSTSGNYKCCAGKGRKEWVKSTARLLEVSRSSRQSKQLQRRQYKSTY